MMELSKEVSRVLQRSRELRADAAIALLWDYLKPAMDHSDRVQTAWGTKTQRGLAMTLERIYTDPVETINPCA